MNNIKIDDGKKTFNINGDPERVISFNPSDPNILVRIKEAQKDIDEAVNKMQSDIKLQDDGNPLDEKMAELIKGVNDLIKEKIDYIFNGEVSSTVFGNTNPLATVKGITIYERFLMGVKPLIEKAIEDEEKESKKRIEKYTDKYTPAKRTKTKK